MSNPNKFTFVISEKLYRTLGMAAHAEGINKSELVREALRQHPAVHAAMQLSKEGPKVVEEGGD